MPAYDLDSDARTIAARLAAPDTLLVACLCAAWCDTCRAYRTTFDALAGLYPGICFVWIDIETHADRIETLEIENFPTILIEDAHRTRFFGVVPAKKRILERLIRHFMAEERMQGDAAPSLRPMLV
ncbi:putative thioredoxin domain [Candidatus Glomeribacter gigasporarum BEG34]|uniref:Putative thioredoxin domain n=1 Tax=Candidatus Glomeribacter gigasporarum BEG34 TaxID=1070319 RepID=G2J7I8_9BURK|nr:thioredoxin family protein [Candidatus Glomeribacter gigasporarum]CCD28733.1 putative thioredoxin domain [Candidatus Glomeribacter gigasporarum BEG34]